MGYTVEQPMEKAPEAWRAVRCERREREKERERAVQTGGRAGDRKRGYTWITEHRTELLHWSPPLGMTFAMQTRSTLLHGTHLHGLPLAGFVLDSREEESDPANETGPSEEAAGVCAPLCGSGQAGPLLGPRRRGNTATVAQPLRYPGQGPKLLFSVIVAK